MFSEALYEIVSEKCYTCNRFDIEKNHHKNILYCFCFCDYFAQEQAKQMCKMFEIDIEEIN